MWGSYNRSQGSRKRFLKIGRAVFFPAFFLAFILAGSFLFYFSHPASQTAASGTETWSTYLANNYRNGFNRAENIINATSASGLKLHWSYQEQAGNGFPVSISTQPVQANGLIYWGSWDGYEHATNLSGTEVWRRSLGYTYSSRCNYQVGIASTPTITSMNIGGKTTPVLFVGGGDAAFWALNATTGAVIWRSPLGSRPSHFIWSSPAFYQGSIYIGVASLGDCPPVRGQLVRLNATTGAIENTFTTMPQGCTGGGVWGSPTIDTSDGSVYFGTGNAPPCSLAGEYGVAVVKLNASTLSLIDAWNVPSTEHVIDGDFGSTPTLFNATIGGAVHSLVGIADKNGVYYAFDRRALHQGPVWQVTLANGSESVGGGCGTTCGRGSISPSAWDGSTLYVAGGNTTINGQNCLGSLRALNPSSGSIIWADCFQDGPVLSAVSGAPGIAVVGEGTHLTIVATSDGHLLYTYADTNTGSAFFGAASIVNGMLYIGNMDGILYAFGT